MDCIRVFYQCLFSELEYCLCLCRKVSDTVWRGGDAFKYLRMMRQPDSSFQKVFKKFL